MAWFGSEVGGVQYSTTEQRIGTWVNGKPLYSITYNGTFPNVTDNTEYTLQNLPANIDITTMWVESAWFEYYSGNVHQGTRQMGFDYNPSSSYLAVWASQLGIKIKSDISSYLNGGNYGIELRYTKTTD